MSEIDVPPPFTKVLHTSCAPFPPYMLCFYYRCRISACIFNMFLHHVVIHMIPQMHLIMLVLFQDTTWWSAPFACDHIPPRITCGGKMWNVCGFFTIYFFKNFHFLILLDFFCVNSCYLSCHVFMLNFMNNFRLSCHFLLFLLLFLHTIPKSWIFCFQGWFYNSTCYNNHMKNYNVSITVLFIRQKMLLAFFSS